METQLLSLPKLRQVGEGQFVSPVIGYVVVQPYGVSWTMSVVHVSQSLSVFFLPKTNGSLSLPRQSSENLEKVPRIWEVVGPGGPR